MLTAYGESLRENALQESDLNEKHAINMVHGHMTEYHTDIMQVSHHYDHYPTMQIRYMR